MPASSTRVGASASSWARPRRTCGRQHARSRHPRWCRASDPAEVDPHSAGPARSSRRCPSANWRSASRSSWSAAPRRRGTAVTARSVDVRGAALEHGPLAEHRARPDLGDRLAVDLDRRAPRRAGGTARRPAALLDEHVALLQLRDSGLAPPRMIVVDSWRSSAVSTAVTSAGESSRPTVCACRTAWRYQSLKSVSPLLAVSVAVVVVHPVAGEAAGAEPARLVRAVGADRELQGGPHESGPGTGRTADASPAGRGDAGAAAGGLGEPDPAVADLGLG